MPLGDTSGSTTQNMIMEGRGGGTPSTPTPPPTPGQIKQEQVVLPDGRVITVLMKYTPIEKFNPLTGMMEVTGYEWTPFSSPIFPQEPSGGAGHAYSSSSQAQEDAQAFQAEQARLAQAFQAEQNRIAAEAQERQNRLDALTALVTNFATNQQKARDTLFQLGPDPFKFAAAMEGGALRGTTPQQAYSQNLSSFANTQLPAVAPGATTADINAVINAFAPGGVVPGLPQGPAAFGMAGGGQASWAAFGPTPTRIRVGELGPETLEVTNQGFRVIPNGQLPVHMGAAEGFDAATLQPALAPLYRAIGLNAPVQSGGGFDVNSLRNLGSSPALVKNPAGTIFWKDPTGAYRGISSWENFANAGFDPKQVVNVPDMTGFNVGSAFVPGDEKLISPFTPPDFGPYGGLLETTSGYVLPAPFRVANALKQLEMTKPDLYNLALSAYEEAGFPRDTVIAQMNAATIQGLTPSTSRRLIGFR